MKNDESKNVSEMRAKQIKTDPNIDKLIKFIENSKIDIKSLKPWEKQFLSQYLIKSKKSKKQICAAQKASSVADLTNSVDQ